MSRKLRQRPPFACVASLLTILAACGSGDLRSTDGGPAESCEEGLTITRSEFESVSKDALRTFYGITSPSDTAFSNGTIVFHDLRDGEAGECAVDDSSLSYRAPLPPRLRPRDQDSHVAIVWSLHGYIEVVVLPGEEGAPIMRGSNPIGTILNLVEGTSLEEATELLDSLRSDYPAADINFYKGDVFGISVEYGRSAVGFNDPAAVRESLEVQAAARANPIVDFVNLSSFWFSEIAKSAPPKTVTAEAIHVDCLRDFSFETSRRTISEFPLPLGRGRHYNLSECPISGWPEECTLVESQECKDWNEAN